MSLVKNGLQIKMDLPKIHLTVIKAKRIAHIKTLKERLIDKTYFGIKILDIDIWLSKRGDMGADIHFTVEYDNEKLTREDYNDFCNKVKEIINAIETNFKK